MKRPIRAFRRDEEGDWVAELSCGHGQHTRHNPPLAERPWVLTEEGRRSRLGAELDCPGCDRREMPDGYEPYRKTPVFTEATVPKALLAEHSTKPGVWARIHVASGELEYRIHAPVDSQEILDAATPGVVLPEIPHEVRPRGSVEFYVEFWRSRGGDTPR